MSLPGPSLLKNHYWFLRHGRSIPNESGLIVSSLSNGLSPGYGLAASGFIQATSAGELFLKNIQDSGIPARNIKLFSSPFSRTRQTAEAVTAVLTQHKLHPTIEFLEDLRERFFGSPLELQSHDHYPEIWKIDAQDPMVGSEGGESVADVAIRVIRALLRIEQEVNGHAVIIVSHGDTLQILQTVIAHALSGAVTENDSLQSHLEEAINPAVLQRHRSFALETGELRRLTQSAAFPTVV
ncbi:hypothetical protein MPTK1_4g15040 [Marchantia polymorpha subsp. ruderalis]|uniref:Histidine phosphatase family protein n=2 Tax=Marchantia polymorpha TaxID=3197 RepID=A0AAF6BA25_MARPO|nr:hypothetical protein MARPO_0119s0027 [Marchantia polymorpha]BBN08859.1 hypothetical protein Mp_4g15040 [Marchantia polymorpha subsp. ruderalis]|eukprot:PTQ30824.1 hypothetical protein MARPO_0119s0027 [Marchantia polymorpha]